MRTWLLAFAALFVAVLPVNAESFVVSGDHASKLQVETIAQFEEPWAMAFLPDGNLLVTEKPGHLYVVSQSGQKREVSGVPTVAYGGQGGLGDVVLHPDFATNALVYVSYIEAGEGDVRGAVVARAILKTGGEPHLEQLEVIWRQAPKTSGEGHYSHRIAFSPDRHLFITSGDRQMFTPSQDMNVNLGKILRLNDDGTVPAGNPFQDKGEMATSFWTIGHRNPLGLAFDSKGQLWSHEMGPKGGDELNLIEPGKNYGWPIVSNGDHYDGTPIPDHQERPEFAAPQVFWNPVIAPAGMVVYTGKLFAQWQGNAIIGGLKSEGLVRVELAPRPGAMLARETERIPFGKRIREVEEAPDGAIWVLEDRAGARLLRLTPGE